MMLNDERLAKKLADLDARDKLLRQRMTKQTELSEARGYAGSCDFMCPERERYLRLGTNQLSIFEKDPLTNQPDESAMVKEYRRAGADQEEPLPHDLRTPKALELSMRHLACNIMDDHRSKSPELALEWYDFLWDRLRAIRKDITQQSICDRAAVALVERCARFHVHSCYALNQVKNFDNDMNKRNLNDCLQMLRPMYADLRTKGVYCPGEQEFQKYDCLLHLDEDILYTNVLMKTSEFRDTPEIKFVTKVVSAYNSSNYYGFLKLMSRADYMTSCILGLYLNKVRLTGLKLIINAVAARQAILYPAELLVEMLAFDDIYDLKNLTTVLDIDLVEKNSKLSARLHRDLIPAIRTNMATNTHLKSVRLIETKMTGHTVGSLIYGPFSEPICEYISPTTFETPTVPIAAPAPAVVAKPCTSAATIAPSSIPMNKTTFQQSPVVQPLVVQLPAALSPMRFVGVDHMGSFGNQPVPASRPAAMVPQKSNNDSETEMPQSVERAELSTFQFCPPIVVSQPDEQLAVSQMPDYTQTDEAYCVIAEDYSMDEMRRAEQRSVSSEIMPAGRFRTITIKRKRPPPARPQEPAPSRPKLAQTSSVISDSVQRLHEGIADESLASKRLFNLVKIFSSSLIPLV